MVVARIRLALAALCMTLLAASGASAQVFGTFSWQMQPYCNIVTLTITQIPGGYTIDGNDNQCGVGGKLAGAAGMALLNPDGTVGLEFTIVTAPSGKAVHVSASINPANGSGPWTDSVGNTGNFALGSPGAGSPRPFPSSGVGPATITAVEIATAAVGAAQIAADAVGAAQIAAGAVGASEIAAGAVGATEIAAGAVRASHIGTITRRSAPSAVILPGSSGSATANCNAGELVLTGGNDSSSANEVFVVASRNSGTTGWAVFAHNNGAVNRTITTYVYCLAP